MEQLSALMEKRQAASKKAMEGLHGRLQAVELAMAKLPEHLKTFKSNHKESKLALKQHAEQLAELQGALPALGEVARECAAHVDELQALRTALAAGPEEALAMFAE